MFDFISVNRYNHDRKKVYEMLNDLLREKSMTKYKLSKLSSIPYTTINDICSGKANLCKCSVDTVYKIAMAMGVTIEELIQPYYIKRPAILPRNPLW